MLMKKGVVSGTNVAHSSIMFDEKREVWMQRVDLTQRQTSAIYERARALCSIESTSLPSTPAELCWTCILHPQDSASTYELCPPLRPASFAASLPFSKLPLLALPP